MPLLTRKEFAELAGLDVLAINRDFKRGKLSHLPGNKKLLDTDNPINAAYVAKHRDGVVVKPVEITESVPKVVKSGADIPKTVLKSPKAVLKITKKVTEKQAKPPKIVPVEPEKKVKTPAKKPEKFHVEPKQVKSHQVKFDKALLEQNARDQLRVDLAYTVQQRTLEKAELDIKIKQLNLDKVAGELLPVDLVRGVLSRNGSSFIKSFEQGIENIATIMCEVMAAGDPTMRPRIIGEMKALLSKCIKDAGGMAEREVTTLVDDYSQTNYRGQKKI